MRMLDWLTVCFAVAAVIGLASGLVFALIGWPLVSGSIVTPEGEVFDSPYTRIGGIFSLMAAVGCFLASGYCIWVLWGKYREWRQWLRFKPPRSYWDVAEDAEEKRKRR